MSLIHLQTFSNLVSARMSKVRLGVEGIESFLFDENTSFAVPEINFTSGGVRLMVNEKDYEKAEKILNSFFEE